MRFAIGRFATHCGHSSTNISTSASGEAGVPHRYPDLSRLSRRRQDHCIEDPVAIEQILTHLGKNAASAQAPRLPPCRAPPRNLFH